MTVKPDRQSSVPIPRIEAYEDETGTVIFDGRNPLAWIQSADTVMLERAA